jgi:hypothetical protein
MKGGESAHGGARSTAAAVDGAISVAKAISATKHRFIEASPCLFVFGPRVVKPPWRRTPAAARKKGQRDGTIWVAESQDSPPLFGGI